MSQELLERAFSEALGLDDGVEFEKLKYRGIEQWDSVAHMALVAAIEEAFDIMLETEDVIDMSSFVRAREILAKHGVVFES